MVVSDYEMLAHRAEQALRRRFPNAENILTEPGHEGRVHLRVVDEAFNPLTERQKQDLLWSVLSEQLDEDEIKRISIALAYGTDEYYNENEI